MKNVLLITTLVSTICALAQNDVIITQKAQSLKISIEDDTPYILEENIKKKLYLKNTNRNTRESVYYSNLDPIVELDVFTEVPTKKGKYKEVTATTIETKDIVQAGIFYGGYKRKDFIYPAVTENAKSTLQYTKEIKDPHLISTFYFNDQDLVKSAAYSITFPSTVKIAHSLFNTEGLDVIFSKDTIKKNIKYTWEIKDLPKREYERYAPSSAYHAPHIIVRIESYTTKKGVINVSKNVEDLFNWYNSLINKIPEYDNEADIKSKVDEIIKYCPSKEDRAKAIFKWVQSNIKYVAFENGMAGFIPRSAGDVFTKKYGDCKDMANLLQTMLNMVEIPAYLTWIGTSAKPYSYDDLPCTIADNHMIATMKLDDDFIFLDATNSFVEYGSPSSGTQNKEALIRISDTDYKIVKVPEMSSNDNTERIVLNLQYDNNLLKGKANTLLTGYEKEQYFSHQLYAKMDNETNFTQKHLEIGNRSAVYTDISSKKLGDKLNIQFDGTFRNEVIDVGDKLYINLNLDPSKDNYEIKNVEKRTVPIQERFKYKHSYTCNFEIPEGYALDFIPENTSLSYPYFSIKTTYTKEENKIVLQKEIVSNFILLDEDQFTNYKLFMDKIRTVNAQKITLKRL